MNDQELSKLLRNLPQGKASPGFTAGVLRETRKDRQQQGGRRESGQLGRWMSGGLLIQRVLVPIGTAFLLVAVWLGHQQWTQQQERTTAIARLENLRLEQQAIEEELTRLQRYKRLQVATNTKPVLYLGSSGDLDLVVDLDRWRRRQNGEAMPAGTSSSRSAQPVLIGTESMNPTPATYAW